MNNPIVKSRHLISNLLFILKFFLSKNGIDKYNDEEKENAIVYVIYRWLSLTRI